jgi:hypothetical protein
MLPALASACISETGTKATSGDVRLESEMSRITAIDLIGTRAHSSRHCLTQQIALRGTDRRSSHHGKSLPVDAQRRLPTMIAPESSAGSALR